MTAPVNPQNTVVIILGASGFPRAPKFGQSPSFKNSAVAFKDHLLTRFGVPCENILDLFDRQDHPSAHIEEIDSFLKDRLSKASSGPSDLILYYVGHGFFIRPKNDYVLALQSTKTDMEGASSLRISDLASTLHERARTLRRYIILDCCFAASATAEFMASPLHLMSTKAEEAFPSRGTALLCSSGLSDASLAPAGEPYTMFSGAFLSVLREGAATSGPYLTLAEVGNCVCELIRERFPERAVHPEVHSPRQKHGNVANVPLFPNPAFSASLAQQRALRGHVLLVGKAEMLRPAKEAQIEIFGYGNPVRTTDSGYFEIYLPDALKSGAPITLSIGMKGFRVWLPWEGKTLVPQDLATQILEVRMLPEGSMRFLSDEAIERLIEQTAAISQRKLHSVEETENQQAELSRYIADWAYKYGFSAKQVKAEVDRWVAQTESNRTDERGLALAAFAKGDFANAAAYAQTSAALKLRDADQLKQKLQEMRESAVRDFELAGHAHFKNNDFANALETYEQGLTCISRQESQELWASLMRSIGATHLAISKHAEGVVAVEHRNASIAHLHQALEIHTRETYPQPWAMTQFNLGNALLEKGVSIEGETANRLLADAISAYRLTLEVHTRETAPFAWASTQENLAIALKELGWRTGGDSGNRLLAEAVEAYKLALQVHTRKAHPFAWARTQSNLGTALMNQCERTEGTVIGALLTKALEAYRSALQVQTREARPLAWALTQTNLGVALSLQGERTEGEAGSQLLTEAVETVRRALQVYTREAVPQDWADAQYSLGTALLRQGERVEGAAGAQLFAQSAEATRLSLQVRTREVLPQAWAIAQNQLGGALLREAERAQGNTKLHLLSGTVEAYRLALQVHTREAFPQDWAAAQGNMGSALRLQGEQTEGEAGTQILVQAVEAHRLSLQIHTRRIRPLAWARTQANLGNALRAQGARTNGEAGEQLLIQAIDAYQLALQVYTREHFPLEWFKTQSTIGQAFTSRSERAPGEAKPQLLAQAIEAYRLALLVDIRKTLSRAWAATQVGLGIALMTQSKHASNELGIRILAEAVDAYHLALQDQVRDTEPLDWATTQTNLGTALMMQAKRTGGEAEIRLLTQALDAYHRALKVQTRDAAPFAQDVTYRNLQIALRAQFQIHYQKLAENPGNPSDWLRLAEFLLLLDQAPQAKALLTSLLNPAELESQLAVSARTMLIIAELARPPMGILRAHLVELRTLIAAQPDQFKNTWDLTNLQCLVDNSSDLLLWRQWLTELFQALQRPQRDDILAALDTALTSLDKSTLPQQGAER